VIAVRGDERVGESGESGHRGAPETATVGYRRLRAFQAALPHAGRYAKSSVRRSFAEVGDTGLEPVTSSVSSAITSRAEKLENACFLAILTSFTRSANSRVRMQVFAENRGTRGENGSLSAGASKHTRPT
jgi:hypothetical protein